MGGEGLFVPFDSCYVVLEEIYGEPALSLSRQLAAMKKTKTTTSLATYLAPGTNNKAIRVIFRKNDISKKCDYERLRSGENGGGGWLWDWPFGGMGRLSLTRVKISRGKVEAKMFFLNF